MSNKLFRIKVIQPVFDELYKKYSESFSVRNSEFSSKSSTGEETNKPRNKKEEALRKLSDLISQTDTLESLKRFSAEHVRWIAGTKKFLQQVFGEKSEYYNTFNSFTWSKRGGYMIGGPARPAESFNPQLGVDRVNQEAYLKELEAARGLLLAAKDDLEETGLLNAKTEGGPIIFPKELLKKLPTDIEEVCEEFNHNFGNSKRWAAMLLLRRLLPLSIVRKFQAMDKENEIKVGGDYLDTKSLLGKIEKYLKEKKVYKDILNYKILTDSSQHSYTFVPELSDVEGAALKIRIFLGDLFS